MSEAVAHEKTAPEEAPETETPASETSLTQQDDSDRKAGAEEADYYADLEKTLNETPDSVDADKAEATDEPEADAPDPGEATEESEATEPASPKEPAEPKEEPAASTEETDTQSSSKPETETEAAPKRQRQFRFRPKNELETRAFEIFKQEKGIEMVDALERARAEMAPKPEEGEDTDSEAPKPTPFPKTVSDTEAKIKELRAERRKAMVDEVDFEKAADLDDQIDDLRDHLTTLERFAEAEAENQESQVEIRIREAQERAVQEYPDVQSAESELSRRMVEIDNYLGESGNPLFNDPDKFYKVAQMAANDLSISPVIPGSTAKPASSGKKSASSVPPKRQASPVQPASGKARTQPQVNNPEAQVTAKVDSIKTELDYEQFIETL